MVMACKFSLRIYIMGLMLTLRRTDPVSSRVEAFMQGFYQAYEFPSDDDNMRNIAVFTRFDI